MATKRNPGRFDCYEKAEPDEQMFILLDRDPVAPWLVLAWAYLRSGQPEKAAEQIEHAYADLAKSGKPILGVASDKIREAKQCASEMLFSPRRAK